jgi:hypothetical protein
MSKHKLHVKLLLEKERVQNEGSFISLLNMRLETPEGFLYFVFLSYVYKRYRNFSETTLIFLPIAFKQNASMAECVAS